MFGTPHTNLPRPGRRRSPIRAASLAVPVLSLWAMAAAGSINGRLGTCAALGTDAIPRSQLLAVSMPDDSSNIVLRRETGSCLLARVPGSAIMAQFLDGALYLGATSTQRSCGNAVALTQIRRYDGALRGTVLLEAPMRGFLVAPARKRVALNTCNHLEIRTFTNSLVYALAHDSVDSRLGSGLQCRTHLVQWSADQRRLWGYVLEGTKVLAVFVLDTDTGSFARFNVEGYHIPASSALNASRELLAYARVEEPAAPANDQRARHNLYVLDLQKNNQRSLGHMQGSEFLAHWTAEDTVEFVENAPHGAQRRFVLN